MTRAASPTIPDPQLTAFGIASGHDVLGVIPVDAREEIVHPLIAILALAVGSFEARRIGR